MPAVLILVGIAVLIGAIPVFSFGYNYMRYSATTDSAIHELNGIVGLGLGGLLLAVALLMFAIAGIAERSRRVADAADRSEAQAAVGSALSTGMADTAIVLKAMGARTTANVMRFVASGAGLFQPSETQLSALRKWFDGLPTDNERVKLALRGLTQMRASQVSEFLILADDVVSKADSQDVRRRILAAAEAVLRVGGAATQPA